MSAVKQYPSQDYLKSIFEYRDGQLISTKTGRGCRTGRAVGSISKTTGYVNVLIEGNLYKAHRIIWVLLNGENPALDIDHIDRDKTNNRIENLRLLTRSQNLHNAKAKRGNKGGCTGVCFIKSKGYWVATICVNYKTTRLGCSRSYFEACCLRKSAELKYFDFS